MQKKVNERIIQSSCVDVKDLFFEFDDITKGLNKKDIELSKSKFGRNNIIDHKKDSVFYRLRRSFVNPYSTILFILAVISLFTDIIFHVNGPKNYLTFSIILVMLLISGLIRFIEELKSKKVNDSLEKIIDIEVLARRNEEWSNIKIEDLVVGDYVKLKAGDRVPADIRILNCQDLFVNESSLTGEYGINEKGNNKLDIEPQKINEFKNIVFQGTTIVSGTMEGVVLCVGKDTIYGNIKSINNRKLAFDKGSNSIIFVLIEFMVILIPLVFIASGITQGDWLSAFLFAISVAVGLTPELLPMVITACLTKGTFNIRQKKTIVKNINAMQSFGNMDILCLDKTGTLTNNKLSLEYYIDVLGNESNNVLNVAYLNSFFSTTFPNHLDKSILEIESMNNQIDNLKFLKTQYKKLDELPFDYNRKISSVLTKKEDKNYILTKGDVKEIIKKCKYVSYKNERILINEANVISVNEIIDEMLNDGLKVLAVAIKETDKETINFDDEKDLTLIGYLGFFDAPKESAKSAIIKLKERNVSIKILTGDNLSTTLSIAKRLGIDTNLFLTGNDLEELNEDEIQIKIEKTTIFAELSPKQKENIITILQNNGHSVGFLGDGTNDLPGMMKADVGISVDTASPSLKEIADVILLEKDLNVLDDGIVEGRKAFANMSKYVKITSSSNLGNILSIGLASLFLPFFPMTSIQILLLNLFYDIICLILPWDKVDKDIINRPLEWNGKNLRRIMLIFGPISSIFDLITFAFLFYYLCPTISGGMYQDLTLESQELFIQIFQTGWFLESIWTQVLILFCLRTNKIPLIQSRPSTPVAITMLLGITIFTISLMTPLGDLLGLITLPIIYFVFLIGVVIMYLLLVTVIKKFYINKYKELI